MKSKPNPGSAGDWGSITFPDFVSLVHSFPII